MILTDLSRDRNYEIIVVPFNSQGSGPPSPPVAVYVGEAVPTGEPREVEALSVSATEVRLKWLPPQQSQQNGDLLGYKVSLLHSSNCIHMNWTELHLNCLFQKKSNSGGIQKTKKIECNRKLLVNEKFLGQGCSVLKKSFAAKNMLFFAFTMFKVLSWRISTRRN